MEKNIVYENNMTGNGSPWATEPHDPRDLRDVPAISVRPYNREAVLLLL